MLPIHSTGNEIGDTGAEHMSRCLTSNTTLLHLNLIGEFLLIDECCQFIQQVVTLDTLELNTCHGVSHQTQHSFISTLHVSFC